MDKEELDERLNLHLGWLQGRDEGVQLRVHGENFSSVILNGVNLSMASMEYVLMRRADLRYSELIDVNLSNSRLAFTDFSYADLKRANLSYSSLHKTNLSNAILRSADLTSADLSFADLRGAELRFAKMHGVDLRYALIDDQTDLYGTGIFINKGNHNCIFNAKDGTITWDDQRFIVDEWIDRIASVAETDIATLAWCEHVDFIKQCNRRISVFISLVDDNSVFTIK